MNLNRESVVSVRDVLRYLEQDRFMPKAEAASYCGTSVRTFEEWMRQIPKYRPGGKVLFKKSDLDRFMESHREQPNDVDLGKLADDVVASILK